MTLKSFGSKALFILLFFGMLTFVPVGLSRENAQENNLATMLLTLKGSEVSCKIRSTDESVAYGQLSDVCRDYLLISMLSTRHYIPFYAISYVQMIGERNTKNTVLTIYLR